MTLTLNDTIDDLDISKSYGYVIISDVWKAVKMR